MISCNPSLKAGVYGRSSKSRFFKAGVYGGSSKSRFFKTVVYGESSYRYLKSGVTQNHKTPAFRLGLME
jgi:hypothetical protein